VTQFGIYLPQLAVSVEDIVDRAIGCERLGFDSFWLYDHLYPPGLPEVASYEGWILATAVLLRTQRLRVGHLVTCNNFRHPVVLAKMAATLDIVSGGRVELGLGSGSIEQEHLAAGLPWGPARERNERLGEALEVITRMFAGPRASFDGRHYRITDLPTAPAPVQSPRPPIHIGGSGPATLALAARYADVWNIPTYGLDRVPELMAAVDRECEAIGRDPATLHRSVQAVLVVAPPDRLDAATEVARRRFGGPGFALDAGGFIGTTSTIVDRVGQLAGAGIGTFIFMTHDRADLDTLSLLAAEVMPAFQSSQCASPRRPDTPQPEEE
jgi:alkanesulfonate monooxygenase SsuD/methylene tetrahydromethanopterin reductase-like flavin-dependent oxidoreductase (luciferase family)